MIVVSHFFSGNSNQFLGVFFFSYVRHYAVVQNKCPRATAPVLCKIIVTRNNLLFFLKSHIKKVCPSTSIPALCKIKGMKL